MLTCTKLSLYVETWKVQLVHFSTILSYFATFFLQLLCSNGAQSDSTSKISLQFYNTRLKYYFYLKDDQNLLKWFRNWITVGFGLAELILVIPATNARMIVFSSETHQNFLQNTKTGNRLNHYIIFHAHCRKTNQRITVEVTDSMKRHINKYDPDGSIQFMKGHLTEWTTKERQSVLQ